MRGHIANFVILGFVLSASAQAGDLIALSPAFAQGGMVTVSVTNQHASPVTGLLIQATLRANGKPKAVMSSYLDIYVNAFHDKAIAPGEVRTIPLISEDVARKWPASIAIAGAVFQDGRRFGADNGLRILIGRRQALQDAINVFRENLVTSKGAGLAAVTAAIDGLTQSQKDRASRVPQEELSILSAGSQVAQWVRGALDAAPPGCGADCVSKRIDYILGGLSVWESQIQKGAAESSVH
jgi:hypothetical protein